MSLFFFTCVIKNYSIGNMNILVLLFIVLMYKVIVSKSLHHCFYMTSRPMWADSIDSWFEFSGKDVREGKREEKVRFFFYYYCASSQAILRKPRCQPWKSALMFRSNGSVLDLSVMSITRSTLAVFRDSVMLEIQLKKISHITGIYHRHI